MPDPVTGVLLLNYGAPSSLADVEPFLNHLFAGRPVQPSVLQGIRRRYQLIGGGSPLLANSCQAAACLAQGLRDRGQQVVVRVGMLHTPPFIGDVVRQMASSGIRRIVAVSMAPFYSGNSSGAYHRAVRDACGQLPTPLDPVCLDSWHLHPLYLEAVRDTIGGELAKCPQPDQAVLVFTAHSVPQGADGDRYQEQYLATVQALMAGHFSQVYRYAYQSRGGGGGAWLGPSLDDVLHQLQSTAARSVVAVPVGFAADHLETLYDLDIDAAGTASGLGLEFHRCPALNSHPLFIRALVDITEDALRKETT